MINHSHLVMARGMQKDLADIEELAKVVLAVNILKEYLSKDETLDLVQVFRQIRREVITMELGYDAE